MNAEVESPFATLAPGEIAFCEHPSGEQIVDSLPDDALANLLVLTTSGTLTRLERLVEARGADPQRVGVVPITGATVRYDGPLWTTERVSPNDLTGISMRFSEAFQHVQPGEGWVLVDSLGVLSMYVDADRLHRFVDSLTGAVRERDARCVLATAEGVLGERTLTRLESMADRKVALPIR